MVQTAGLTRRTQVFVSQQQFLIDKARYKGQQPCPVESIAHGRTFIIDDTTSRIALVF
jgi:hypothetical protein